MIGERGADGVWVLWRRISGAAVPEAVSNQMTTGSNARINGKTRAP